MRIGIFSESYEPLLNGVAVSVGTLSRELRQLGHDVFIFAPAYEGYEDQSENVVRFPSRRTMFERDYPVPIPFVRGVTRQIGDLHLDVIHTQTPWILGWMGFVIARRLNLPIVSTNHTLYAEYVHYFTIAPIAVARSFTIGMMKRYYNACSGVVVPSNATSDILRGYGVTTPTFTIPTGNSLDTSRDEQARDAIRNEHGIEPGQKVLIYVGRFAREKNLELLLKSFERISAQHKDVVLLMVGGGPFEEECRKLASELKANDRVIFTGAVPRQKVAKYYSAGDLFVFPSLTETQGLVLGEALQSGLPCVAVNSGGSPEMLMNGEDSMLSVNSVDDFTLKIDTFLSDQALMSRFSARAVENAVRFSPRGMATKMLEVYESAIAGSAAR